MRLGHTQLPGKSGVSDAGPGRSAGAAIVAADQDNVRPSLGHPRGNGAHADLGNQLDVNPGQGIGVLQVVDQLGQVFNGINVVVRRG